MLKAFCYRLYQTKAQQKAQQDVGVAEVGLQRNISNPKEQL